MYLPASPGGLCDRASRVRGYRIPVLASKSSLPRMRFPMCRRIDGLLMVRTEFQFQSAFEFEDGCRISHRVLQISDEHGRREFVVWDSSRHVFTYSGGFSHLAIEAVSSRGKRYGGSHHRLSVFSGAFVRENNFPSAMLAVGERNLRKTRGLRRARPGTFSTAFMRNRVVLGEKLENEFIVRAVPQEVRVWRTFTSHTFGTFVSITILSRDELI